MKGSHRAWNRSYLFLLLVVLSLQWRGAVRQSSSFLFENLCILNIIIVIIMNILGLWTTTRKLEPIDQF